MTPPPPLPPRKPKDNDNTPASAGAGGGSKDGMNKNLLAPTSIVLVAVVFPPLGETVVAVVEKGADARKLKLDPIIANPPLLTGGGGALSSSFAVQFPGISPEGCLPANPPFFTRM
jgi:hypothetical protein